MSRSRKTQRCCRGCSGRLGSCAAIAAATAARGAAGWLASAAVYAETADGAAAAPKTAPCPGSTQGPSMFSLRCAPPSAPRGCDASSAWATPATGPGKTGPESASALEKASANPHVCGQPHAVVRPSLQLAAPAAPPHPATERRCCLSKHAALPSPPPAAPPSSIASQQAPAGRRRSGRAEARRPELSATLVGSGRPPLSFFGASSLGFRPSADAVRLHRGGLPWVSVPHKHQAQARPNQNARRAKLTDRAAGLLGGTSIRSGAVAVSSSSPGIGGSSYWLTPFSGW